MIAKSHVNENSIPLFSILSRYCNRILINPFLNWQHNLSLYICYAIWVLLACYPDKINVFNFGAVDRSRRAYRIKEHILIFKPDKFKFVIKTLSYPFSFTAFREISKTYIVNRSWQRVFQ